MRAALALSLIATTATSAVAWTPAPRPTYVVDVAGGEAFGDAAQVVPMRHGTRTVLSVQSAYDGPVDAFAMIVPVPAGLRATDVQALPRGVVAHIDQIGAPLLEESWPEDDCLDRPAPPRPPRFGAVAVGVPGALVARGAPGVTIEAQFTAGEYQLAVVAATDPARLAAWLRAERYAVPAGAAAALAPSLAGGMQLLVAKVDPAKATFVGGRLALSPLRLTYERDDLALPVALGLARPDGPHDLIVSILGPLQAYRLAGRAPIVMPDGAYPAARDAFERFYAAEFARVQADHPGAVVTETTWGIVEDGWRSDVGPAGLAMLGLDALAVPAGAGLELTRLHARGDGPVTPALAFEPVPGLNTVSTRYTIAHPGRRPGACASRWSDPPPAVRSPRQGSWATGDLAALAGVGVGVALLALAVRRRPRRGGQV
ncbi:MAG: DUF2330 domain-containing protein [Myxococcales bacterium]|nr:DUF2330 domain-containing protein [Myxococcales bacterium]